MNEIFFVVSDPQTCVMHNIIMLYNIINEHTRPHTIVMMPARPYFSGWPPYISTRVRRGKKTHFRNPSQTIHTALDDGGVFIGTTLFGQSAARGLYCYADGIIIIFRTHGIAIMLFNSCLAPENSLPADFAYYNV